ncbi:TlpA disulfide reductase family protein [Flavobacterium sp. DGU38]|uniref:TlpA disulfide reductase family protein n=1 Tax=Flavobacterium calami TaxID=3139144 RepID=A0ABU9IPR3_9FLAO
MKLTAILISLLWSACVFAQAQENDEAAFGFQINDTAADFVQKDAQGKDIRLSDFKGGYVLIDFWASWCAPCISEMPAFISVYDKYHSKGFEILAVSLDKKKELWTQAIEKNKIPWVNVSDLKGWTGTAARTYKIIGLPSNLLVDPAGKVIAKNLSAETLHLKLKEIYHL